MLAQYLMTASNDSYSPASECMKILIIAVLAIVLGFAYGTDYARNKMRHPDTDDIGILQRKLDAEKMNNRALMNRINGLQGMLSRQIRITDDLNKEIRVIKGQEVK